CIVVFFFFFFQAEDGIRDLTVTGVQTCTLPIWLLLRPPYRRPDGRGTGPASGRPAADRAARGVRGDLPAPFRRRPSVLARPRAELLPGRRDRIPRCRPASHHARALPGEQRP